MSENAPEQAGWFDPAKVPAEAPQTGTPQDAAAALPEKLEVAKTDGPAPDATATANESVGVPPETEAGKLAADAKPVLIHLAHAIDAVDTFAREHPGLDAIFANGLKAALLALEHAAA